MPKRQHIEGAVNDRGEEQFMGQSTSACVSSVVKSTARELVYKVYCLVKTRVLSYDVFIIYPVYAS
jgi:hypothetical protein